MAKLTAKTRAAIPSSQFGLAQARAYPVEDRAHAIQAKSRATQQVAAGNLTPSQKATIDAKADKVLKRGK